MPGKLLDKPSGEAISRQSVGPYQILSEMGYVAIAEEKESATVTVLLTLAGRDWVREMDHLHEQSNAGSALETREARKEFLAMTAAFDDN